MYYENKHRPVVPRHEFARRMGQHLLIGFSIIFISLLIGMYGYHHFERMDWVNAYENAAMILSGMGPVDPLLTVKGKIFAGTYALFSGIIFLIVIAIFIAPLFHRFFHKFMINDVT
jgi:TM2 domain-containing membrane protein YozV